MNMEKIEKFPVPTEQEVQELEQMIGTRLPEDYRQFLLEMGGCYLYDDDTIGEIPLEDSDEVISVEQLYGLHADFKEGNIHFWDKYWEETQEVGVYKNNCVLIGDASEHGFLFLMCHGENSGVWYWDDCRTFPETSDENGDVYFVAESFEEFWKMLCESKPLEIVFD